MPAVSQNFAIELSNRDKTKKTFFLYFVLPNKETFLQY